VVTELPLKSVKVFSFGIDKLIVVRNVLLPATGWRRVESSSHHPCGVVELFSAQRAVLPSIFIGAKVWLTGVVAASGTTIDAIAPI
jgi:hypothetical protein